MSERDRFAFDADATRFAETFQLEEIPQLDVDKFETIERAAVERLITEQQASLVRLQTDMLDVRSERTALERQLSKTEAERETLRERVGELEAQRPAVEPKRVFSNLGAALKEVDDDLASERYRVDDVDFTLKTNVIQTDEGIRMHLPSLDESSVSANLSEVSFRLRAPRGEPAEAGPTYTDVPDLRGQPREVAARRLAAADLTVGTVERVADPEAAPGTVVEQFPEPYAVAEPGSPVDLVLSEASEDEPETTESEPETPEDEPETTSEAPAEPKTPGESEPEPSPESDAQSGGEGDDQSDAPDPDDERARMEAFRRAVIDVDPENGEAVVERLRRAGVTDLESLVNLDSEKIAAELSLPVEQIVALQKRLGGHGEPIALEEVSGIGPTYASRLREKGVRNVSQLAALDPQTVAEITLASTSRAEGWIEQAARMAADR
ncbi:PASTA domain-containing protein [Halorubrum lipolyticum]|uniref:PASTA domain containing protein n=1 Tax=Halorubrum lipolyticum DSM 21995 TaxID=1227482 RepID=M0NKG9_9EURY|nr:PASTA domain-containing protein [Halorubrum lipolyticum]EMA57180.1 PASTA domain containing protein [Halorubrum lipolyticum DSM 21995]